MTIDVIRLAREAGMNVSMWNYGAGSMAFTMGIEGVARGAIERFAALVAAAEREECAKVCENLPMQQAIDVRDQAASAIRARKPA